MSTRLVLLGGGDHVVTVSHVIERINAVAGAFEVVGVLDDGAPDIGRLAALGLAWLGPVAALCSLDADAWFPAVGTPAGRRSICAATAGCRLPAAVVTDPSTTTGRDAHLAAGAFTGVAVDLGPGAVLGEHTLVAVGSVIGTGCTVGRFASVLIGAVIGSGVRIGEGATIGSGAIVSAGVRIGPWAVVGAGTVVDRDVPAGVTVVGNPAHRGR